MRPLDFIVSPGPGGWFVVANGIDCGVVADRVTALANAERWAREAGQQHGRSARVLVDEGCGPQLEWDSQTDLDPLGRAAAAMRGTSAYFVRELADFRPLYISG